MSFIGGDLIRYRSIPEQQVKEIVGSCELQSRAEAARKQMPLFHGFPYVSFPEGSVIEEFLEQFIEELKNRKRLLISEAYHWNCFLSVKIFAPDLIWKPKQEECHRIDLVTADKVVYNYFGIIVFIKCN